MILLDVGVWLAAVWGRHAHHPATADWFGRQSGDLVFCRVTQMSFLRLLSNPAIMGEDAVDRSQAWRTFDQLWADERVLWADEPDELDAVWRAISARNDKSHRLWTDDYLAAFAQAMDFTLATLDGKFPSRYPSVRVESLLPLPIPSVPSCLPNTSALESRVPDAVLAPPPCLVSRGGRCEPETQRMGYLVG
jgi:toxin-antitoxin system PIN domain toxin